MSSAWARRGSGSAPSGVRSVDPIYELLRDARRGPAVELSHVCHGILAGGGLEGHRPLGRDQAVHAVAAADLSVVASPRAPARSRAPPRRPPAPRGIATSSPSVQLEGQRALTGRVSGPRLLDGARLALRGARGQHQVGLAFHGPGSSSERHVVPPATRRPARRPECPQHRSGRSSRASGEAGSSPRVQGSVDDSPECPAAPARPAARPHHGKLSDGDAARRRERQEHDEIGALTGTERTDPHQRRAAPPFP